LFDVVLEGILHKKDCPYPYVSCYCRITAALTLNQVTTVWKCCCMQYDISVLVFLLMIYVHYMWCASVLTYLLVDVHMTWWLNTSLF